MPTSFTVPLHRAPRKQTSAAQKRTRRVKTDQLWWSLVVLGWVRTSGVFAESWHQGIPHIFSKLSTEHSLGLWIHYLTISNPVWCIVSTAIVTRSTFGKAKQEIWDLAEEMWEWLQEGYDGQSKLELGLKNCHNVNCKGISALEAMSRERGTKQFNPDDQRRAC